MKGPTEFFQHGDAVLMTRVFHPFAWWFDARYHRNQFFLASVCVVAAMLVLALQAAWDALVLHGWMKLVCIVALMVNVFLYQGWLTRFQAASKWQEDHPGKLAWPHHSFVMYPGQLRFAQLLFSLFILLLLAPFSITTGDLSMLAPGTWLMLIGFSMCFAGVLPPDPGARREKKERALAILAPAPS